MKIKLNNNILFFIIFYIVLILFLYFFNTKFLLSSFLDIEEKQNKNNIMTIINILNKNIESIKNTTNDYSKWDKTYEFIQNANRSYIYENFREGTSTLNDLNLDAIIYKNLKKETIFSQYSENFSKNTQIKLEQFLFEKFKKEKEITTIFSYNNTLFYFSKNQILKSDKSGKPKGYILAIKEIQISDFEKKQSAFKKIYYKKTKKEQVSQTLTLKNYLKVNLSIETKKENKLINTLELFDEYKQYIISLILVNDRALITKSENTILLFNIVISFILLIVFYIMYKFQYLIENQNRLLNVKVNRKTSQLSRAFRDLESKNKELFTLANIDTLTKIRNRRSFFLESEDALQNSIDKDENFCILLIDIDHFKSINDSYGHYVGDKVLIEFCTIVSSSLDENAIFGRIGGEEFCISFYNKTIEEVNLISEDIRKKCEDKIITLDKHKITFTVSMGLSCKDKYVDIDKILQQSDELLYKAKRTGRNRVIRKNR